MASTKITTPGSLVGLAALLSELMLPDDVAELRQFTELCRKSLAVRSWLFVRFGEEPETRAAFRMLLSKEAPGAVKARLWSPQLAEMVLAGPASAEPATGPHGGLSRARLLGLIIRYQYERMDLKTFLLVRLWTRLIASGQGEAPAALSRATLAHWRTVVADPSGVMARDVLRAVRFFSDRAGRAIGETDFGYVNTWKIHVLLYILDFPKARYQVAELKAGLPPKYRGVDRKLIRRFCQLHGIRRDTAPGERPGSREHTFKRWRP